MLLISLMISSLILCLICAWIIIFKLHSFNEELSSILKFILTILALLLFSKYCDSRNIEDLREEIKEIRNQDS